MYGLRRPNCHHGKMLGSTSFHILWTFKSVFSPCPYGIVVVVFHFDSGGRKARVPSQHTSDPPVFRQQGHIVSRNIYATTIWNHHFPPCVSACGAVERYGSRTKVLQARNKNIENSWWFGNWKARQRYLTENLVAFFCWRKVNGREGVLATEKVVRGINENKFLFGSNDTGFFRVSDPHNCRSKVRSKVCLYIAHLANRPFRKTKFCLSTHSIAHAGSEQVHGGFFSHNGSIPNFCFLLRNFRAEMTAPARCKIFATKASHNIKKRPYLPALRFVPKLVLPNGSHLATQCNFQ